jgi:hypothetical protein
VKLVVWTLAASVAALTSVVALPLATTDGYGCENGCSGYERALLNAGPAVVWLSVLLGVTTIVFASLRRMRRDTRRRAREPRR